VFLAKNKPKKLHSVALSITILSLVSPTYGSKEIVTTHSTQIFVMLCNC